jgi:MATE family multidrug resistance protein
MVGIFGTASLAATTIVVRYMHVGFMPAMALASALVAMVGKAIGEGNPDLAQRHVKTALRVTILYMVTVGILFFVMRYQLLGAFTDSAETVAIGVNIMLCVAFFQFFDALNIIYSHALRAAGDTLWFAVVGGVICLVVFIGGGVAIINLLPKLGGLGPWLMGTVYLSLFALMMRFRWRSGAWRRMNIFKESGGQAT